MTDSSFLYFAYGSNLGRRRLCANSRAPSARFLCIGYLSGRQLTFNKVSKDGSGKCDCVPTVNPDDSVWGAVYAINTRDRGALDRAEGLGFGYKAETVSVQTASGSIDALTYSATKTSVGLRPYVWYKHHVLAGAEEVGLPAEYVERIRATEEVPDLDAARHADELAIYEFGHEQDSSRTLG